MPTIHLQPLRFTLSASDPDGNALSFNALGLPPGASFDPAARRFTRTPTFDQAGTYPGVRFSVSDGTSTDFEEITLTVLDALLPQEAAHARSFVEAMWDSGEAHFWTGTLEDGVAINREPVPPDVQAWAVLALGKGYPGGLD